jgi:hypothetical protein
LIVPGRNQAGPVAMAGTSYRDVVPAVDYFMKQLVVPSTSSSARAMEERDGMVLNGRVQCNVRDPKEPIWEGMFRIQGRPHRPSQQLQQSLEPYWVFQNRNDNLCEASWNVMACELLLLPSSPSTAWTTTASTTILEKLQVCIDDIKFQMGNRILEEMDVFFHSYRNDTPASTDTTTTSRGSIAFAAGKIDHLTLLFHEVEKIRIT